MKKHNAVSTHDLKLAIINNPGVKPIVMGIMLGIDAAEVRKSRRELNIPYRGRPVECKG